MFIFAQLDYWISLILRVIPIHLPVVRERLRKQTATVHLAFSFQATYSDESGADHTTMILLRLSQNVCVLKNKNKVKEQG